MICKSLPFFKFPTWIKKEEYKTVGITAALTGYMWRKKGAELLFLNLSLLWPEAKLHLSLCGQTRKGKVLIGSITGASLSNNLTSPPWDLPLSRRISSCVFSSSLTTSNKVFFFPFFFLLCAQVAGPGVHGPLRRLVPASPHSVGGAQPLPSLVHTQPHRDPTVWTGLHHAHCC